MSTNCHTARRAPAPTLDRGLLASLLDGLLDACDLADHPLESIDPSEVHQPRDRCDPLDLGDLATMAVCVTGTDPATLEIALHPLEGPDPVRELYGFTAPSDWSAFGVVAPAHARRLDAPGQAGLAVWIAMAVSRGGEQVTATRGPLGPLGDDGPVGRIPDLCRRVLGLSTTAPTSPVLELWASLWLERVLVESLAHPGARSWADVAGVFPGVDPATLDPADEVAVTRALVEAGRQTGSVTWRQLRRHWARQPSPDVLALDPDEAAWMDEGMFSRELLGHFPRLDRLVDELDPLIGPATAREVGRALQAWGLA